MHDQYPQPIQLPEVAELNNGERIALDLNTSIYSPTEIGLPEQVNNDSFSIVGEITLKSDSEEDSADFAVVRVNNSYNTAFEIGLVSLTKTENGKDATNSKFIKIPEGDAVTLGRSVDVTDPFVLDGQLLTGKAFSKGISRRHATLKLDGTSLTIEDGSSNGTKVVHEASTKSSPDQPSRVLISEVPKDDVEIREINDRVQLERDLKTEQELEAIRRDMDQLREGLSEKDLMALWKYGSGLIGMKGSTFSKTLDAFMNSNVKILLDEKIPIKQN
jgi:pSer/pThr/pTyr-binding forkhead associated (FHA) protein